MAKKEEKKVSIKAKKVGPNLIIMVGNKRFTVPNVSEKDIKSIQNKILLYGKNPTEAKKQTILDIIDLASQKEEKQKAEEKGLKKSIKTAKKEDSKQVGEKKEAVKKIISKIQKSKVKSEVAKYLVTTKTGGMAMKGAEVVEMPELLVKRIEEFLDKEQDIKPLLNFWSLCLLNPNEIARIKLFDYLQRNGLMITPSGYFVTYRMVKRHDVNNNLLPNDTFTDARTHSMRYIPGTVCRIPREECDEDGTRDCSKGLHTGTPLFIGIVAEKKTAGKLEAGKNVGEGYGFITKKVVTKEERPNSYGTNYDYVPVERKQQFDESFGNQAIICLINPQHVVSVPDSDTRKMRSCEFYFCKLTTPEEVIDMVQKDYLIFDHDYQNFELKDLQELLKDKEFKIYVEIKGNIGAKIHSLERKLAQKREEMKIGGDNISDDLDLMSIKAIINQRIKTLK